MTTNKTSRNLYLRALKVLPGAVSRESIMYDGPLLYVKSGQGYTVTDVNGTEIIDFSNNMTTHIHGHAFEPIVEAVSKQLKRGTAFTMATEEEVEYAEFLCNRSPSFERIRFINSGTEAVMAGIKASRAFTNKAKVAKVEGGYHGAYDYAEVSQGSTPENWGQLDSPNSVALAKGTPRGLVDDMIVIPFNETEKAISILNNYKDQLACVLIDLMPHRLGFIPAKDDFVKSLKKWTLENNSLLMVDEVITYRNDYGGMQERYAITPDLTSMGKMIGGGFPVGALAGRAEVMSVFESGKQGLRLPLSGTFSANPITMTAGLTAMKYYNKDQVQKLNELTNYAKIQLNSIIQSSSLPISITGTGSLLRIHFKKSKPQNYRESYMNKTEKKAMGILINSMYDKGIMIMHSGAISFSTPMNKSVVDKFCDAFAATIPLLSPVIDKI